MYVYPSNHMNVYFISMCLSPKNYKIDEYFAFYIGSHFTVFVLFCADLILQRERLYRVHIQGVRPGLVRIITWSQAEDGEAWWLR